MGYHKGKPHKQLKSSTGKVRGVKADQTNWRKKLQNSRLKFDDDQKAIYLAALAKNGLKGRAAEAAGVALLTVHRHIENDPDFAEQCDISQTTYRDRVVDHHTNLLFEGEIHRRFDNKTGELVEEKHVYPIPLIVLELKRVEPGYRDKQQIDLISSEGGVLVAPAAMTPEEWIKQQEELNKTKEPPEGLKQDDG